MSRDADYNTPAHIDRDEARSLGGYDDGYEARADYDITTDAEIEALRRDHAPGDGCWDCWVHIHDGGCDVHRVARRAWFAERRQA